MTPEEAMRRALAEARRGLGRTFPNPSVGAVLFRRSGVLGVGHTQPPPGPHAEVVALQASRRRSARSLRGASVAVTLEPCCFSGRTGPCTEALIEAGVARVYVGCRDPHPRVAGRGMRRLRAAGIEVQTGVLEEECRELHRGFFSLWGRNRPFVTLKLATSLDARIATASGESRWITGSPARGFVHRLRARADAVMVGSGTALADDPALTARRGDDIVHRPVRVLVDSRLRVPTSAALYQGVPERRTVVLARAGARGLAVRRRAGTEVLEVRARGAYLDLADGLRKLADAGLTTLLVEGGGMLAAALLRAKLVDEIHWLQAPILLGGDARPALGALELSRLRDAVVLPDAARRSLGQDLHWKARLGADRPGGTSRERGGNGGRG
jgi:diaminohydroxyphosphoribosylaminopyrimidine deaminase/5-amino-6-(5-phosphoribosylamino)uracil reductase